MLSAFCKQLARQDGISVWYTTHVKIDNLSQQRSNDENEQNPEEPLLELVDWGSLANSGNNGSTKTLSRNDTQSADKAADGEIDKHALVAVAGTSPKSSKGTAYKDNSGVRQEARCDDKVLHLLNIGSRRLLGSI